MKITDYYAFTTIQKERTYQILHKGNLIQKSNLEHLAVRMLEADSIPNVLPIVVEEEDAQLCIQYDITGLQSLKEYINYKGFYMEDLYRLVESIVSIIERNDSTILNMNKFSLHSEDLIYVDNHLHTVKLLYIPLQHIEYKHSFQEDLQMLLSSLSQYIQDFNPESFKRLFEILQSSSFQLKDLKDGVFMLQSPSIEQSQKSSEMIDNPEIVEKAKEKRYTMKPILNLNQIIGIVLICVGWIAYYVMPSQTLLYIVSVLTGLGCLLIVSRYIKKSSSEKVEKEEGDPKAIEVPIEMPVIPAKEKETPKKPEIDPTVLMSVQTKSNVNEVQQFMKNRPSVHIRLVMKNGEQIVGKNDSFTLGRNEDIVDYVIATSGVSRAHVKIVKLNNTSYGIKDLQSKNGTKLNGKRIEPSKVYPLQNGDVIRIATEELTVYLDWVE